MAPRVSLMDEKGKPGCAVERLLFGLLLAIIFAVFVRCAVPETDWEILATKHYWSATDWYYGGFGWQISETPRGYRTVQKEGLGNYWNIFALQETLSAKQAQYRVQGYPGTERLDVSFLVYGLLHLTGVSVNIWSVFWLMNVLLWLATILLAYRIAALFYPDSYAPWFSAMLVAMYPVLTLTFNGIKLQPLGSTYLLLGIYIFERHLSTVGLLLRAVGLTALVFLGMFANGGWVLLVAFIFFRA